MPPIEEFEYLPIEVEDVYDSVVDCLIIGGKMKQDFGPWGIGSTRNLTFNFVKGIAQEFDDNGLELATVNFNLTVRE